MEKHHYVGFKYLLTQGCIMDFKLLFEDFPEKMEDEGKITVIRPIRPVEVGRMEKDTAKLRALYEEGYVLADVIK